MQAWNSSCRSFTSCFPSLVPSRGRVSHNLFAATATLDGRSVPTTSLLNKSRVFPSTARSPTSKSALSPALPSTTGTARWSTPSDLATSRRPFDPPPLNFRGSFSHPSYLSSVPLPASPALLPLQVIPLSVPFQAIFLSPPPLMSFELTVYRRS